jgi:hypothetical protein
MSLSQGLCAYNGKLYASWKGESGDDRLFYAAFDGTKWDDQTTIPGGSLIGPSLAEIAEGHDSYMYAAWRGEHEDPRLYYSRFDGTSWTDQAQLPGNTDVGPTIAGFNGRLYAGWKGEWSDLCQYYAAFDGTTWTQQHMIPGVASVTGPCLCSFKDRLYAAWRGPIRDEGIYYASFDGSKWSGQLAGEAYTQIQGVASSVGPSLAVFESKLYGAWKGEGSDPALYYVTFDGSVWSGQSVIPGAQSSIGPALAVFDDKLYAMWKDSTSEALHLASFDGSRWVAEPGLPGITGQDLALTPSNGLGSNSNYQFYNDCNPILDLQVRIEVTQDLIGSDGFSFQLNSYPPAGHTLVWQQYFISFQPQSDGTGKLFGYVDDWSASAVVIGDAPELVSLPSAVIPAGYTLTIELANDSNGNVTGVTFAVLDQHTQTVGKQVIELSPVGDVAPIASFELDLVGPIGGEATVLSSGTGTITYRASHTLTALSEPPACANVTLITLECANSAYGRLPLGANPVFVQLFGIDTSSRTPWTQ